MHGRPSHLEPNQIESRIAIGQSTKHIHYYCYTGALHVQSHHPVSFENTHLHRIHNSIAMQWKKRKKAEKKTKRNAIKKEMHIFKTYCKMDLDVVYMCREE